MVVSMLIWIFVPVNYALVEVVGNLSLVVDNVIVNVTTFISMIKLYILWSNRKSKKSFKLSLKIFIIIFVVSSQSVA